MSDRRNEIQIGLFAVIGIVLLALLVLVFGGFRNFLADVYPITAYFPNAAGVAEGTPVRLRGIEVGRVKAISLAQGRLGVVMVIEIQQKVEIPADAQLAIKQEGFIANLYLEFSGGTVREYLPKDGTASVEGRIETFAAYIERATSTVTSIGDRVGDRIVAVTDGLLALTTNLNDVTGNPEFRENVKRLTANSAEVTAQLRERLPTLMDNFNNTAVRAQQSLARMEELLATYQKLGEGLATTNEEFQAQLARQGDNLDRLQASLVETSTNVSALASSLNDIAVAVREGRGSAGKLITDDELYRSIVRSFDTVANAVEEIQSLAETIKRHPDWLIKGPPEGRR